MSIFIVPTFLTLIAWIIMYLDANMKIEAIGRFYRFLRQERNLFLSFSDYVDQMDGFDTILLENKNIYKSECYEKGSSNFKWWDG